MHDGKWHDGGIVAVSDGCVGGSGGSKGDVVTDRWTDGRTRTVRPDNNRTLDSKQIIVITLYVAALNDLSDRTVSRSAGRSAGWSV